MKLLKWHREFVLFMAVQFAIYDMAKVQKSLSMTIMSSIELLIQAQQAAMIAAVSQPPLRLVQVLRDRIKKNMIIWRCI